MNVRTLIGQSVHRAEDFRFLKGAGTFIDDMKRDGMLHAVVLRSPVAHGRIRNVDTSAARTIKGVHAVIAAADMGAIPVIPLRLANLPEFKDYLQPVIAKDKVRYVGEPIAVVVANGCRRCPTATRPRPAMRCCSRGWATARSNTR
jgi:carbon-monoxide dehydrogenase large subunit